MVVEFALEASPDYRLEASALFLAELDETRQGLAIYSDFQPDEGLPRMVRDGGIKLNSEVLRHSFSAWRFCDRHGRNLSLSSWSAPYIRLDRGPHRGRRRRQNGFQLIVCVSGSTAEPTQETVQFGMAAIFMSQRLASAGEAIQIENHGLDEVYTVNHIETRIVIGISRHHARTRASNVPAASVAVAGDGVKMTLNEELVLEPMLTRHACDGLTAQA